MVSINDVVISLIDTKEDVVRAAKGLHPYNINGRPETMCEYNHGWHDAIELLEKYIIGTEWGKEKCRR